MGCVRNDEGAASAYCQAQGLNNAVAFSSFAFSVASTWRGTQSVYRYCGTQPLSSPFPACAAFSVITCC